MPAASLARPAPLAPVAAALVATRVEPEVLRFE
jgi:hypothetical protein